MASNQIGLQLVQLVGSDPNVGELSESGIDPVNRLPRADGPLDYATTLDQRAPGLDRDEVPWADEIDCSKEIK